MEQTPTHPSTALPDNGEVTETAACDGIAIADIQASAPGGSRPADLLPYQHSLGSLSTRFETGGRGAATVSGGVGDYGGVSYGTYQMTSRSADVVGGTVAQFIAAPEFPWASNFHGLTPGTPPFTAAWKSLVAASPDAFAAAEHAFIDRTLYQALCNSVRKGCGVDIVQRSNALQNVVWSVAVQHGAGTGLVTRAVQNAQQQGRDCSSDQQLINAIYDERSRRTADGSLAYFSKCSANVQAGVSKRFTQERAEALTWLSHDPEFGQDV